MWGVLLNRTATTLTSARNPRLTFVSKLLSLSIARTCNNVRNSRVKIYVLCPTHCYTSNSHPRVCGEHVCPGDGIDCGSRAPILNPLDPGRRKGRKKGDPPGAPPSIQSGGIPLKKGEFYAIFTPKLKGQIWETGVALQTWVGGEHEMEAVGARPGDEHGSTGG